MEQYYVISTHDVIQSTSTLKGHQPFLTPQYTAQQPLVQKDSYTPKRSCNCISPLLHPLYSATHKTMLSIWISNELMFCIPLKKPWLGVFFLISSQVLKYLLESQKCLFSPKWEFWNWHILSVEVVEFCTHTPHYSLDQGSWPGNRWYFLGEYNRPLHTLFHFINYSVYSFTYSIFFSIFIIYFIISWLIDWLIYHSGLFILNFFISLFIYSFILYSFTY